MSRDRATIQYATVVEPYNPEPTADLDESEFAIYERLAEQLLDPEGRIMYLATKVLLGETSFDDLLKAICFTQVPADPLRPNLMAVLLPHRALGRRMDLAIEWNARNGAPAPASSAPREGSGRAVMRRFLGMLGAIENALSPSIRGAGPPRARPREHRAAAPDRSRTGTSQSGADRPSPSPDLRPRPPGTAGPDRVERPA